MLVNLNCELFCLKNVTTSKEELLLKFFVLWNYCYIAGLEEHH